MKLVFCEECEDIVRLTMETRKCKCGECGGRYTDKDNAVYWGENAIPLVISNGSLGRAILLQPLEGDGFPFEAFVIPQNVPTMKQIDPPED